MVLWKRTRRNGEKRRDEIGRAHTTPDARTRTAVEPYTTDGRALTQRPTGRRFYTRFFFPYVTHAHARLVLSYIICVQPPPPSPDPFLPLEKLVSSPAAAVSERRRRRHYRTPPQPTDRPRTYVRDDAPARRLLYNNTMYGVIHINHIMPHAIVITNFVRSKAENIVFCVQSNFG